MTDKPLTPAQIRVLKAAARGDLYRRELGGIIRSFEIRTQRTDHQDVTRVVNRINACEVRLLELGELERFRRPWLLTDAGRAVLEGDT